MNLEMNNLPELIITLSASLCMIVLTHYTVKDPKLQTERLKLQTERLKLENDCIRKDCIRKFKSVEIN